MLGNGAYLEEQDRQAALIRNRPALTPAQVAAQKVMNEKIRIKANALRLMNMQAPNARLPLAPYQEKMRQLIMAGEFEKFNVMMTISKFGWSAKTPLGMYRFRIRNGRKIYKPFSDVELATLFVYMAGAANRYGYNRFAEPGSTCDWERLLETYVNNQVAAAKQYPNTDWRHVVEIYPGRYICQVYRPSTWVKIRKPVVAAVAIVAAIYLGPIIAAKMAEAQAATAAGAGAGGATTAAETTTLLTKIQKAVKVVNKVRTINAMVHGEIPPPPFDISGGTFTEVALNYAKKEIKDAVVEKIGEKVGGYIADKMAEKEIKKQEAALRAEIQAMQRELAKLVPKNTPAVPSPLLDPPIREKIIEMQNVERKRSADQNLMLGMMGAGGALLLLG